MRKHVSMSTDQPYNSRQFGNEMLNMALPGHILGKNDGMTEMLAGATPWQATPCWGLKTGKNREKQKKKKIIQRKKEFGKRAQAP